MIHAVGPNFYENGKNRQLCRDLVHTTIINALETFMQLGSQFPGKAESIAIPAISSGKVSLSYLQYDHYYTIV